MDPISDEDLNELREELKGRNAEWTTYVSTLEGLIARLDQAEYTRDLTAKHNHELMEASQVSAVPREPTDEMMAAGIDVMKRFGAAKPGPPQMWRAMYDAAPTTAGQKKMTEDGYDGY